MEQKLVVHKKDGTIYKDTLYLSLRSVDKNSHAGHVARRHAAADIASLDGPLLGDDVDVLDPEIVFGGREPRRHRGAAAPGDAVGDVHGLDGAGHLEGEIDAAAGGLAYLLDTIGIARVGGRVDHGAAR